MHESHPDSRPAGPAASILPVALFTAAYMAAAVWGAFASGNSEFVFYIVIMVVLIAVVWTVHARVALTAATLWALSAWGLLHMAGGLVPAPQGWPTNEGASVLYSVWLIPERLKYDQVVHAFGFGVTTWVCWQGLKAAMVADGREVAPTFGLLLLCWAAGLGFGALNEVVEFVAVLTIPETNVGGYRNTGWDLVANAVGATVAAFAIRFGES